MAEGPGDGGDTREAIMLATYRVLHQHGYAGLSIARIAAETDLTKAALYHHFDGKDDLLLSFMEFMLDHIREEFVVDESDPRAALGAYLDAAFLGPSGRFAGPDGETMTGRGTYVEVRAQAVHDEAYRERVDRMDETFQDRLAAVVRRGVDAGVFREVDPDLAAEVLLTLSLGAVFRRQTAGDVPVEAMRETVERLVDAWLVVDG
jgi:AcrR family transcriptional regulator